MATFRKIDEDNEKIFDSVKEESSIPRWVEFGVFANDDLKELYQVKKMSDFNEFISDGLNIAVIINEEIFDQLPEEDKKLALEEALAGVKVDENDKISVEKFDFTTYTGMLQKHGDEKMIRLNESIKALFDQMEEQKKQAKAEKQAGKK